MRLLSKLLWNSIFLMDKDERWGRITRNPEEAAIYFIMNRSRITLKEGQLIIRLAIPYLSANGIATLCIVNHLRVVFPNHEVKILHRKDVDNLRDSKGRAEVAGVIVTVSVQGNIFNG